MSDQASQIHGGEIVDRVPAVGNLVANSDRDRFREMRPVASEFLDIDIDQGAMYVAPLPVCSGVEDRDGEVIDPAGIIDVEFRKNPLVFLNHSHFVAPMIPPIGTAETPDRKYDVHTRDGVMYGGTRFAQSIPAGYQAFSMVCEGLLRARSIGALTHGMKPHKPRNPQVTMRRGVIQPMRQKSIVRSITEMVEFSWVWIPANRDMVVAMKSLLSNNRIAGERMDDGIRMVLKSLNLDEPDTSAKHGGAVYADRFGSIFDSIHIPDPPKGEDMKSRIVAVRFSDEHYTAGRASLALKSSSIFADTGLKTEDVDGQLYLRSDQVADYNGECSIREDDRFPGMQILCAKSFISRGECKQDQQEEGMRGGPRAHVDEGGKNANSIDAASLDQAVKELADDEGDEGAAPEVSGKSPEQMAEEAVKEIKEEAPKGPIGSQYLQTLIQKLSEVVEQAEASSDELEPEVVAKCGGMLDEVRKNVEMMKDYHEKRYNNSKSPDVKSKPDEGGEKAVDSSEDADPEVKKSINADLFHGRSSAVPQHVMDRLVKFGAQLQGVSGAEAIGSELSGFVGKSFAIQPALSEPEESPTLEQLQEELERREMIETIERLT